MGSPSSFENPNRLRYPEWQCEFEQVLLENPQTVLNRVMAAEAVIWRRAQALSGDSEHQEELQAIRDALKILRILMQEFGDPL
jgi:hypothetical protein